MPAEREAPDTERLVDVPASLRGAQTRLWRGVPVPPQDWRHRQAKCLGQVLGLIETTPQATPRVQRYWNDAGGVGEDVMAAFTHQLAKGRGQRSPAVVLECVDDLAERTGIVTSCSGDGDDACGPLDDWWRFDRRPAFPADAAFQRRDEWELARRTLRRECHPERRIGDAYANPNRLRFSHSALRLMPSITAARAWCPCVRSRVSAR